MRARNFAAAVLWLAPLVACGGGNGNIGTPTSPSGAVTSLTIAPGTDLLKIKGSENFTASAITSNGTSSAVTPAWRSDNTAVVTIDAGGKATALTSGTATIIAEHQGVSATRLLRVVPDYHGSWRGTMRLLTCEDDGDWEGACDEITPGTLDSVSMTITQQGASIAATLNLGGFAGSVNGTIGNDGSLVLSGTYSTTLDGFPFQVSLLEWQSISTDNDRMNGRTTFTLRSSLLAGQAHFEAQLINVNKTASTLAQRAEPSTGELAKAAMRAAKAQGAASR